MPRPIKIEVSFTYQHERDPLFWEAAVPVDLRAEVVIDASGDPEATPLDKARWQDDLGPETTGTKLGANGARELVESPAWIGAKEAACDAACEQISKQSTRESNAMAVAS